MAGSNKKFYTNGVINCRLSDDDIIPEGFYRGITKNITKTNKGTVWINKNNQFKMVPRESLDTWIEEGWVIGGHKVSEEIRRKISETHKGITHSEETKQKLSNLNSNKLVVHKENKEYHIEKEQLQEYLDNGYKRGRSDITKQHLSETNKGHQVSEETKLKISEKNKGRKLTEEQQKKWSQVKLGHIVSEETRKKISIIRKEWLKNNPECSFFSKEAHEKATQTLIEKFNSGYNVWNKGLTKETDERVAKMASNLAGRSFTMSEEAKLHHSQAMLNPEVQNKINKTKKERKSFSSSKEEDIYYNWLCNKFGTEDVIRQYFDISRYPFSCDFYIKSQDLFIECNFSWTHNDHLFDETNIEDVTLLEKWKNSSKYYRNAAETWGRRDLIKYQTACKNNLNYRIFYTLEEGYSL